MTGSFDAARDHLAANYPTLDTLLIMQRGDVALAYERTPGALDTPHNLKSATKSVLSALIGIALAAGDIPSLDDTIGRLVPAWFTPSTDPRLRSIRVRDLLMMRSGLDWAEFHGPTTVQMTASPDWVRFVLERPLIHDPGTRHNYSTGDTHLLAALLHQRTGMSALDFATYYLFQPLGITGASWATDPQGINVGGSELMLTPRDMLKFGQLYLHRGQWDGEQVMPADWVRLSTQPHPLPPGAQDCTPLRYGFLWWLRPQGDYNCYMAVGYGGQFITVIPALDLAVVLTGDIRNPPEPFNDNDMLCQFNLVQDFIVPDA